MHTIKILVLDMAGTTVNEGNVVYKTLQKAILDAGIEVDFETVLKLGAGKEKLQAVKDILQHLNHDIPAEEVKAKAIHQHFLIELDQAYQDLEVLPYSGLEEMFSTLMDGGVKVVLNTGYNREVANQLLDKMSWQEGRQFDLLVTASDVENGRPAPDMIDFAMQSLDIDNPREVAKIGDSIIDIEEGQAAGCGFVAGVTTGAHTKEQLESANPDYIFDELLEVLEYISLPVAPV